MRVEEQLPESVQGLVMVLNDLVNQRGWQAEDCVGHFAAAVRPNSTIDFETWRRLAPTGVLRDYGLASLFSETVLPKTEYGKRASLLSKEDFLVMNDKKVLLTQIERWQKEIDVARLDVKAVAGYLGLGRYF